MNTCLYFTYDGLLDPLGQSQILPYIENLSKNGYNIIIISYEKDFQSKRNIKILSKKLNQKGIQWKPLVFRKGKIHFIYRIIIGAIYINLFNFKKNLDLIHLRGGYAGLIFFFSLCRTKYLYDLRAFWGQWADGGRTKHSSFTLRMLLKLERVLIHRASGLIVLDKSGEEFIKKTFKITKPLTVIPTATNIRKYKIKNKLIDKNFFSYKFVYLGGVRFPPYRIIDAIKLIKCLNKFGLKSKIDFINKNEHHLIKELISREKLSKKLYSILSLNHEEIFEKLPTYDIGLVFLEKGKWINMSSPTKIGEYLASGLSIISNKGIAVLDRLSNESECIQTIDDFENEIIFKRKSINNLLMKSKDTNSKKESRKLAQKYYSLENANKKYLNIYNKITDETQ